MCVLLPPLPTDKNNYQLKRRTLIWKRNKLNIMKRWFPILDKVSMTQFQLMWQAADDKESTRENRIHILLQMLQHNAVMAESAMNTLLDTLTGAVSKSNDAIMPIEATQLRMIASPIKEQMISTITDIASVLINEVISASEKSE